MDNTNNYGLPTTITINGKEKAYIIDNLVEQYNKLGRLPGITHIYCTKTLKLITCHGPNLLGKVQRHGGIKELLTTFVCKDAGGNTMRATAGISKLDIENLKKELEAAKAQLAALQPATQEPAGEPADGTLQLTDGNEESDSQLATIE